MHIVIEDKNNDNNTIYNILNNNRRLRSTLMTCFVALSGLVLVLFFIFYIFNDEPPNIHYESWFRVT